MRTAWKRKMVYGEEELYTSGFFPATTPATELVVTLDMVVVASC